MNRIRYRHQPEKCIFVLLGLLAMSGCTPDEEESGFKPTNEPTPRVTTNVGYGDPNVMPEGERRDYTLTIHVRSNAGFVLSGVPVRIVVDDHVGNTNQQRVTNTGGNAVFQFYTHPNALVFVDAQATGFSNASLDIRLGANQGPNATIYLAPL